MIIIRSSILSFGSIVISMFFGRPYLPKVFDKLTDVQGFGNL